jgi:hypothetical protein
MIFGGMPSNVRHFAPSDTCSKKSFDPPAVFILTFDGVPQ